MDIKRNLLAGRTPMLVAEAVDVLAVVSRVKGVVAVRSRLFKDLVLALGVGDL